MRVAMRNRSFLKLTAIVFTLAMGFNFVGLLNYYISIFYLYGGDKAAAGPLLGINGTVWAVTGLVAVFPLNWISRRCGKTWTLGIAILLMCGAQFSKIFCYNPQLPYLVIIPTVLLSSGMLMFFTLGSSMLGDICDEDELKTGTRSEGSYYSIYWWIIKMGTALASFVTGALILLSQFDEQQTVRIDALAGKVRVAMVEEDTASTAASLSEAEETANALVSYFAAQADARPASESHYRELEGQMQDIAASLESIEPDQQEAQESLLLRIQDAAQQSPATLLRLRQIEIGLPIVLCILTLWLLRLYPLSEERAYEIKAELEARKEAESEATS
jgi:GPH family glycoside/pentoside/hexuronide:cation symporter